MTQTPYTTTEAVGSYLGRDLTIDQAVRVSALIDAVTAYIDNVTGKKWNIDGATFECVLPRDLRVHLPLYPVKSVTSVASRRATIGDSWTTLTADTDYELLLASQGLIEFKTLTAFSELLPFDGGTVTMPRRHVEQLLQIAYVPDRPIPADLADAATQIVGASALSVLFPGRLGISSIQLDPDTRVQYSSGQKLLVTPVVDSTLQQYRPYAVIA